MLDTVLWKLLRTARIKRISNSEVLRNVEVKQDLNIMKK